MERKKQLQEILKPKSKPQPTRFIWSNGQTSQTAEGTPTVTIRFTEGVKAITVFNGNADNQ
ncbi:hypothetical protein [Epilithonimonas hominis]|uniref:Uncharacterized protein n=1 Tax=Epilithonimonas hominis TaxID=420404 RepID=A0A1H6K6N0_9FLAO|nr:hypothetical protein [Epilithonimonas hominis]SEH71044.1 hypothetical protein SAMN05421793_12216 [Epilithonimonas hominis]